jgi:hypothetical protein|tara:strand:- start:933 stop:1133 length:201 start_codon:yes stop_codon:yes gene_type:complete
MNRHRALLRSDRIVVSRDENLYCMHLPQVVLDNIGWEVNDVVIIDTIKNGMNITVQLKREGPDEGA